MQANQSVWYVFFVNFYSIQVDILKKNLTYYHITLYDIQKYE